MAGEQRSDRFTAIEERLAGYEVYDRNGEKVGKVDDLFVDENDNPEYIGVKMGLFGLSGTSLVPMEIARVNDDQQRVEVDVDKDTVKNGPNFDDDQDITPEFEERVYSHYGLQRAEPTPERGAYDDYYVEEETAGVGTTDRTGETTDEDELRVQRTEEELRAGTREREAGGVRVRKRVRTDREQVEVPKRREEVHVDRVPVEGEAATEAEIGDDEVRVPVTEEEVVTEKRPVAKEEVRIRKDVVEDTETIEEDVRREEVDVDDETERGTR